MQHPSRLGRLAAGLALALTLTILGASIALAQGELGGKFRAGSDVRVPANETVPSDLYAFGGTVAVNGTIEGDLVVSGGTIDLDGTVTGDVIAAGGTLRVGGTIEGDVRLAGGTIVIVGDVSEDALLAGGQVDLAADGRVGEDMIVSSGTLTLAGTVDGSVDGTTGAYTLTGSVAGEDGIAVRDDDVFEAPTVTDRVLDAIRQFITVFIVGMVALWLAPRFMTGAESTVRARPLVAAGAGLLGLIGFVVLAMAIAVAFVVVAVFLGLIGFGGLAALDILAGLVAMGGLILAFVLVAGFLADAVVGLALAVLVGRAAGTTTEPGTPWRPDGRTAVLLAAGAAVVVLLSHLPVIGWFVKLLVVLLGLGAILWVLWQRRTPATGRPAPTPAA